jgi:hypothetical protein
MPPPEEEPPLVPKLPPLPPLLPKPPLDPAPKPWLEPPHANGASSAMGTIAQHTRNALRIQEPDSSVRWKGMTPRLRD